MKVGTHSAATVLCTELRHNLHKFSQDLKGNQTQGNSIRAGQTNWWENAQDRM